MELTDETKVRKQDLPLAKANLTGVKVLMVEDNDLNAEIAAIQLEERGMQVTRAVDGKEVVEIFASHPADTFDIILMDIMMPKMDGYEAARGNPCLGETCSGRSADSGYDWEARWNALDRGMDGFVPKPVEINGPFETLAGIIK